MAFLKIFSADKKQDGGCGCSSTAPKACGCSGSSCSSTSPQHQRKDAPFETNPSQVLLHPELVPEDPAALNWIITSFPRDLSLAVAHPESPLTALVERDVLEEVRGGTGTILTRASSPEAWKDIAGEVRRAVEDTVLAAQLTLSGVDTQTDSGDSALDAPLADIAPQVLERYVRPLAGAHGGKIEITKISGGTVWVYLDGACRGCPAAKFTLQQRFQRELDRRVPGAKVQETR